MSFSPPLAAAPFLQAFPLLLSLLSHASASPTHPPTPSPSPSPRHAQTLFKIGTAIALPKRADFGLDENFVVVITAVLTALVMILLVDLVARLVVRARGTVVSRRSILRRHLFAAALNPLQLLQWFFVASGHFSRTTTGLIAGAGAGAAKAKQKRKLNRCAAPRENCRGGWQQHPLEHGTNGRCLPGDGYDPVAGQHLGRVHSDGVCPPSASYYSSPFITPYASHNTSSDTDADADASIASNSLSHAGPRTIAKGAAAAAPFAARARPRTTTRSDSAPYEQKATLPFWERVFVIAVAVALLATEVLLIFATTTTHIPVFIDRRKMPTFSIRPHANTEFNNHGKLSCISYPLTNETDFETTSSIFVCLKYASFPDLARPLEATYQSPTPTAAASGASGKARRHVVVVTAAPAAPSRAPLPVPPFDLRRSAACLVGIQQKAFLLRSFVQCGRTSVASHPNVQLSPGEGLPSYKVRVNATVADATSALQMVMSAWRFKQTGEVREERIVVNQSARQSQAPSGSGSSEAAPGVSSHGGEEEKQSGNSSPPPEAQWQDWRVTMVVDITARKMNHTEATAADKLLSIINTSFNVNGTGEAFSGDAINGPFLHEDEKTKHTPLIRYCRPWMSMVAAMVMLSVLTFIWLVVVFGFRLTAGVDERWAWVALFRDVATVHDFNCYGREHTIYLEHTQESLLN